MGKITNDNLPDMQKSKENFHKIPIGKVGVRNVEQWLPIKMKDGSIQRVQAKLSSYCYLQEDLAGINMSRCSQVINEVLNNSSGSGFTDLEDFCKILVDRHQSPDVYIKARFKLLFDKLTPMSDIQTIEPVECVIESQYKKGEYKTFVTVGLVGMSMCPCAKALASLETCTTPEEWEFIKNIPNESLRWKIMNAGYASHSQKSKITVTVELLKDLENIFWIEDLIQMISKAFSTPTFMTAKRCDEGYIVQTAYLGGFFDDNKNFNKVEGTGPKFVEHEARDLAVQLNEELDKRIKDYVLVCENYESLHSMDETAVAILSAGRTLE